MEEAMDYTIKLLRQLTINDINFRNPVATKDLFRDMMDALDRMYNDVVNLKRENQELKDLVNSLKGEKDRPDIKPNKKKNKEHHQVKKSQMETNTKKTWKKSSKVDKLKIDRQEIIPIDPSILPEDAQFKGYEERPVQNIKIITDNVLYKLEKYYSPSQNKTYIAQMPDSIGSSEFAPDLKALCVSLYFDHRVIENKILSFLTSCGIHISEGTLSNILTLENAAELSEEAEAIFRAGQKSSNYQHMDDTGFWVNGQNKYAHIVCNDYYSSFFIRDKKNRDTIEDILLRSKGDVADFDILVTDDAKQFSGVTDKRALCWIHEERHYKKLTPFFKVHQDLVDDFRESIWEYYKQLKEYQENPTEDKKILLNQKFDTLFNTQTGYTALDERIKLTREKKKYLLTVLDHPEVPLHNNLAERGLRSIVVKRKISGGTKTSEGTTAWENYMTILETCKKLGVNFMDYIKDIFSGEHTKPRLSDLIPVRSNMSGIEYIYQGTEVI
jgi:hypothetical protein